MMFPLNREKNTSSLCIIRNKTFDPRLYKLQFHTPTTNLTNAPKPIHLQYLRIVHTPHILLTYITNLTSNTPHANSLLPPLLDMEKYRSLVAHTSAFKQQYGRAG